MPSLFFNPDTGEVREIDLRADLATALNAVSEIVAKIAVLHGIRPDDSQHLLIEDRGPGSFGTLRSRGRVERLPATPIIAFLSGPGR